MKNADMPAMPCQGSIDRDNDAPRPYQFGNDDFVFPGLTKREYFAGLAMNRILAKDERGVMSPEITAQASVRMADALLAELEKEPRL